MALLRVQSAQPGFLYAAAEEIAGFGQEPE